MRNGITIKMGAAATTISHHSVGTLRFDAKPVKRIIAAPDGFRGKYSHLYTSGKPYTVTVDNVFPVEEFNKAVKAVARLVA